MLSFTRIYWFLVTLYMFDGAWSELPHVDSRASSLCVCPNRQTVVLNVVHNESCLYIFSLQSTSVSNKSVTPFSGANAKAANMWIVDANSSSSKISYLEDEFMHMISCLKRDGNDSNITGNKIYSTLFTQKS